MRAYNKLILLLLALCPQPALALSSVNVMADSNLSIAISKIARNYSRRTNAIVNTSYASPKLQQAQITEGGAADILITPNQQWIDELKTQGLIDVYSQALIASDRLVLVGPADSPLNIHLSEDFPTASLIQQMGFEPGLILGNPETLQEGVYAKEAMRSMNAASDMEPYTLYIKEREEMFESIVSRQDYGVFFLSSTMGKAGIKVLDVFPEKTHKPIQYFAVVVAGENMNEARHFLDYLRTSPASEIFQNEGFSAD